MKIVIFGLTISSSWGNGHATLWRGLCRALARRGHSVTFFERDVPYYAIHRDLRELPGTDLRLYPDWDQILPEARREVADADALSFFSLNSAGYLDYFGPEATHRKVAYTLRRLRPEARRYLDGLRLRPVVAAALAEELGALAA